MKSLVGLAIIALLAVFGSRAFERNVPLPLLIGRLYSNGIVYLFLGILLGPMWLGFINDNLIEKLSPIVSIGLFWIGFLFGINLKIRDMKRFTSRVYLLGFGQAIFTFAAVAVVFYVILDHTFAGAGPVAIAAATITLAACASQTSQATLLRLSRDRRFRGPNAQVATVTATLDDAPAILASGLLTFFWHQTQVGRTALPGFAWMALAVTLGVIGGGVIKLLLERSENEQELLLIVLGSMGIGGGLVAYLHLSPLFVGAIMGFAYVNLSERNGRLFRMVASFEGTLYVLFLVLVGSMVDLRWEYIALFAPAYILVRAIAKLGGVALFTVSGPGIPKTSRLVGFALLSQGGMAIALVIHYRNLYASPLADTIVTLVILGVLINEFYAAPLAQWVAGRGRR